jgi:hypothetical protein
MLARRQVGHYGTIIYYVRKVATRDRRLMQFGVRFTATVIDIRRSIIEVNRQTRWHCGRH